MTMTKNVNGVDIDLTPEEEAEVLAMWAANAPALDDLKDAKVAEINAACLAAIDGGFEHDGHIFDSDPRSKSNIIGTATGLTAGVPLPEGFTWRTQGNQDVPMDGADVIALGAALLQHISTQYAIGWQLKEQVDLAPDQAALDTINWPA